LNVALIEPFPATEPANALPVMLDALVALHEGERDVRLPAHWGGVAGSIAAAFGEVVDDHARLADDLLASVRDESRRTALLEALDDALDRQDDSPALVQCLLDYVVPSLSTTAVIALLHDDGRVAHVAHRATIDDDTVEVDLVPRALPAAHFALLRKAWDWYSPVDGPRTPAVEPGSAAVAHPDWTDGALRMFPLRDGRQLLGALWIDGETTAPGVSMLPDVVRRAQLAFARGRLHRQMRSEVEQRERLQARLDDAERRKGEFLAMLSHELRNPLAPIRNAIEVMRLAAAPESRIGWAVDVTDRQVRHLGRLVDALLDVARLNEGKIVLQPECVDFSAIVAHCVDDHRAAIAQHGLSLGMSLPQTPLQLSGDATRLAQVVDDLLSNAVKFTPEGGTVVVALSREDSVQGSYALLRVQDDGIGIEPALLPHVFDLFSQGSRELDRRQGGLGIGLTLARRLVELHDGTIVATSGGAGQGAEFELRLPCLVASLAPMAGPSVPASSLRASSILRRILVVEDNPDVLDTTTMLLSLTGHEVQGAKDGLEALQVAAEFTPDVVLLDIGLPLMDGYEVARRLRQLPGGADTLLIALTGYGQEADRQRGKDAGFDEHLVKPVDPGLLARLIEY
jgi:signal transduction histidine kinase/CheY-like chemotaxis protein